MAQKTVFSKGRTIFWFQYLRYVVFGGGRTIFLVWGFANIRESRTYDSVYDLRSTSCFVGRMFQFGYSVAPKYHTVLSSGFGVPNHVDYTCSSMT